MIPTILMEEVILMIESFAHKGLQKLYETGSRKGIDPGLAKRLILQLDYLNRAKKVEDMNLPGYRLHELEGKRKGTWAIKASGNWRVTFKFKDGKASDVNLEDYH
jgi:proteic killer suppression protein